MINAKLLEVRRAVKARKPNFQIQNSNDPKKRFAGRWKRPKGLQSKMRERRKGNPKYIEPGYGSPAAVRGATEEGLFPVVVRNVSDLGKVKDDASYGGIISATVSVRKKVQIAKVAAERRLKLLNLNLNAEELAKRLGESMAVRKTRRIELLQKRKVKGEVKKKEAAPGIESKVDDEEAKKKAEKAEKDKVLITKAK